MSKLKINYQNTLDWSCKIEHDGFFNPNWFVGEIDVRKVVISVVDCETNVFLVSLTIFRRVSITPVEKIKANV